MAGETIKTEGLVLDIRPWSRTSHVVTWLTPDCGPVTTLVKGAVRPKSAFVGQYDLFYTCELIYYARAKGELHAIREVTPLNLREHLRGNFRAAAFASYASCLIRECCPHNGEAAEWFRLLEESLDALAATPVTAWTLGAFELRFLELAGLSPGFAGADFAAESVPFAVDLGRAGTGAKTVHLPPGAAALLARRRGETSEDVRNEDVNVALRFLGIFLRYHLDLPPDIRRNTLQLMMASSVS